MMSGITCFLFLTLSDYLEDENQVLAKQREKFLSRQHAAERKAREAVDSKTLLEPSQPTVQAEEESEEEEGLQDEAAADEEEESEMVGKTSEATPWANPEMEVGEGWRKARGRPSIVGMRIREPQEDIVDLDSFVNQHYKAKALASSWVKQRTLQRKEEQEPKPVFGLGMELDAGFGMVGLQPVEGDFDMNVGQQRKRLQKRELVGQYFTEESSHRGHWMSVLSIGFSKLDISLCVILYFLSSVCLLAMYLFFKNHLRLRRAKVSLP